MAKTILVLNADGTPINMASFKQGYLLIHKGKAQVLAYEENQIINTEKLTLKRPVVIQLVKYVVLPYKRLNLSKVNILKRDKHTCVYCGSKEQLTLDHVIPRSRGGKNTWENLATSCLSCNRKKGARTPEEANMVMQGNPTIPTNLTFLSPQQLAQVVISQ